MSKPAIPTATARPVAVTETPSPRGGPADYADAFEVSTSAVHTRTAQQWASFGLEQGPWPLRQLLPVAWQTLLRLRLGPRPSPGHVHGWQIVSAQPALVELESHSPLLAARMLLRLEESRATLTTFIHYRKRSMATLVWRIAAPVHRRVVPHLLAHTARRFAHNIQS